MTTVGGIARPSSSGVLGGTQQLSTLRVGPVDAKSKFPAIGLLPEAFTTKKKKYKEETIFVRKELSSFGSGFKIPEEYRKKRMARQSEKKTAEAHESEEERDSNQVTREEIFALLNLGSADGGAGSGKYGNSSKQALTNDIIEGLEKDLDRLKRFEENLRTRKLLTMKGGKEILEETEEDREKMRIDAIKDDVKADGAHIIHADEARLQLLRHQAGQLDSIKNLSLEELEAQRLAAKKRSDELSEAYYRKQEAKVTGKAIRKKLKSYAGDEGAESSREPSARGGASVESEEAHDLNPRAKKSVRIAEGEIAPEAPRGRSGMRSKPSLKGGLGGTDLDLGKVRATSKPSRSRSQSKGASALRTQSPRREIFEAKFDKYLANKSQKEAVEKRAKAIQQPAFDITTRGRGSPSKRARGYGTVVGADPDARQSGNYDANFLMPEDYEDHLLREEILRQKQSDPFKLLGVSNEDKMSFFLLKWVFNAIKLESEHNDPVLKGNAYVTKSELVNQLAQNPELMAALDVNSKRKLEKEIQEASSAKNGCLTWHEFLDYFFLRNAELHDRIDANDWWNKLDGEGHPMLEKGKGKNKRATAGVDQEDEDTTFGGNKSGDEMFGQSPSRMSKLMLEYKEVPMTPALKMLLETRKVKVEKDVEDDFNNLQGVGSGAGATGMSGPNKGLSSKSTALGSTAAQTGTVDQQKIDQQLGITREKSKCLLLPSQIEAMKSEYEALDDMNFQVLKRREFITRLRTEARIVDFIDAEAVKVAGHQKKVLTLDQVLLEIERDEMYEMGQMDRGEDEINHKEYISWREFLSYFEDYKEIEERNKRTKHIEKMRENLRNATQGKDQNEQGHNPEDEFKSLLETEKERRLKELPKIRPADQIDISEEQLELIKGIFDSQVQNQNNTVNSVTFFSALRKHPEMRKLSTAIARDPEGHSRIPRETFQQVMDRMERDLQSKQIEWATVIEFFTKLGRPMTKDEITRLIEDDKRINEEQAERKRRQEENERRRLQRFGDDPNVTNDIEADLDLLEGDGQNRRRQASGSDGIRSDGECESDYSDNSLERDVHHSKSMKNLRNEGNLGNQRVNAGDYMRHINYRSQSRGRYGVTVPQAFGFDVRESSKPKSIRERKVELMVREKQLQEEGLVKKQFRSKPVPASVLVPRYQAIQEANEQRRLKVKQESIEITKQKEKPFSFWEREKVKQAQREQIENEGLNAECRRPGFRAKSPPKSSMSQFFHEELEFKEKLRKERIQKKAEESMAKASMPRRMQKAQDEIKESGPKSKLEPEQYSFQPRVNKAKTAAKFKKMQDAFQSNLNKTKAQARTTQVTEFNFTKPKSKPLERTYVNEGMSSTVGVGVGQTAANTATTSVFDKAAGGDKLKATLAQRSIQSAKTSKNSTSAPVKQPSSTRSNALLQQRRREELEQKRADEIKKIAEDEDRVKRQNALKATVQGMLRSKVNDSKSKIEEAAKKKREDARQMEKQNKEAIEKAKQRGRQRPMVCESYGKKSSNLDKLKATKDFLQVLEKNGNSKQMAESFLSPEQKELLEEDKFVQAQKKKYGRADEPTAAEKEAGLKKLLGE